MGGGLKVAGVVGALSQVWCFMLCCAVVFPWCYVCCTCLSVLLELAPLRAWFIRMGTRDARCKISADEATAARRLSAAGHSEILV